MRVISDGTLALLRKIKEGAMLDTVVIRGPNTRTVTTLPDGGWEVDDTETEPVATVGMVGPVSKTAIERLQADGLEYTGLEQVDVPKDVAVTGEDTLTVTSARHGTIRTYTVEAVVPLDTYAVAKSVIVKAV